MLPWARRTKARPGAPRPEQNSKSVKQANPTVEIRDSQSNASPTAGEGNTQAWGAARVQTLAALGFEMVRPAGANSPADCLLSEALRSGSGASRC